MTALTLAEPVLDELRSIPGDDGSLVDKPARYCRTRVPAPFPGHRWDDHLLGRHRLVRARAFMMPDPSLRESQIAGRRAVARRRRSNIVCNVSPRTRAAPIRFARP